MSGDIVPTHGEVWLNNYNLTTNPEFVYINLFFLFLQLFSDALKYFGWCPQFDALIGSLTGYEQLTMYARIKGLEESIIHETVTAFLQMLDLDSYAHRVVAKYP